MGDNLICNLCSKAYCILQTCHKDVKSAMKDSYGSHDTPKLLVCGHAFCYQCLVNLYQKKKGIQCPTCGAWTECLNDKNGIKGLYPHMGAIGFLFLSEIKHLSRLTDLVDSLCKKKILKRSMSGLNCSECMQQTAVLNCVQCGVNICSECFDMIHQNSRVLKRHQSIPITKSAHNLASLDCSKHHTLTDYFCVDDNALICRECVHQDHASHNIISLQEKSQKMVPDVKRSLHEVSLVKSSLEKSIHDIEGEILDIHAEAKQTSNDILSYFMEASGKLQSNYLMLMSDLEQSAYERMHYLSTMRDAASSQLKNIEFLCGDASLILNSEKENDAAVVDPVKTLQAMKLAAKSKCVFKKVVDDSADNDCGDNSRRFSLKINGDVSRLEELGTFHDSRRFMYLSEKVDCGDVDALSDSNLSDSQSETSPRVEVTEKPQADKPMVVRIPPAQNQEIVFVSLVSSPDNFYIQRRCDQPQLNMIERGLKVFSYRPAQESDLLSCICVGELCVACTSARKWCRAKVIKVIKQNEAEDVVGEGMAQGRDQVELFLIDYGKMAKTKVSCLRSLPQQFQHIPPLAFPCSLVGINPSKKNGSWSESAIQMFGKMVANRPVLMTTVKREGGRRYVDLHKPAADEIDHDIPVSVRDALVFMEVARFISGSNTIEWPATGRVARRDFFKPSTIPARTSVNVVLSHYQSISRFFVQLLDSSTDYLEALSDKIQKFANKKSASGFDVTSPFSILKPCVNMPCLAKYDCCGMWFRAKIINVSEKNHEVEVYYVDYGNEAVVSVKKLLKIPDEFMKLPYQGLECRLSDILPADDSVDWSQESLDRFFELVGEDQLRMLVRSHDEGVYSVELFEWTDECRLADNQLSVNERLVHEGLATGLTVHKVVEKKTPPREEVQVKKKSTVTAPEVKAPMEVPPSTNSNQSTVTVVHCKSPALFYTQSEEQWKSSNKLTRDLHKIMRDNEAAQAKQASDWTVDDDCVFHSLHEKRWCRGKITNVGEEHCEVQLIDFGITEKIPISTLRHLPNQFVTASAHVTGCYIANIQPAGGKKWSSTAQDLFSDMVLKKQCRIELCGRVRGGVQPVKLFLPGTLDEDTEVGRELILRGVALPVIRLNADKDCSTSLSRIQQEFKRSQAAYQEAENLHRSNDLPIDQPDCVSLPDQPHTAPATPTLEQTRPVTPSPSPASQSTPLSPVQQNAFSPEDSLSPQDPSSAPNTSTPSFHSESFTDDLKLVEDKEPDSSESVENLSVEIPFSEALEPGSTFPCCVTHIEKYNIVCIKKLPVEPVFPDGTDCIGEAPLLKEFAPGTPCLAKFDDDNRWYRAEVAAYNGETVFVCFVDYGLTQAIDDTNKLLVLPDECKVLPRQAIVCSLPAMPTPVEAGLLEEQYLTVLATVIGDHHYLCTVKDEFDSEWGCPMVGLKLQDTETALSQMLANALAFNDYKPL